MGVALLLTEHTTHGYVAYMAKIRNEMNINGTVIKRPKTDAIGQLALLEVTDHPTRAHR